MRAIIFWNFPIFFIICCMPANLFSIVFSSVTETPLPLAIRCRRRALRMCGLRRSCGVIPQIIASMWLKLLLLLAHVGPFERFGAAGQHAHDRFQRSQLLHLAQLLQEVFQRELAFAHLLFHALRVVQVHGLGRFLDQADHVAHAQDPRCHALRMKRLEVFQLLPHARELDRLAGHRPQAERRAAARIPVQLRQDRAGNIQRLVEVRRHVDRFLARGGIEHQQRFLRFDQVAQPDQLLHQRLVNLQAARRIENERVPVIRLGEGERLARDLEHIRLAFVHIHRQFQLLSQRLKLIHRRRPIHIRRHQQRRAPLLMQQPPQLPARGGLAGAVQADHQHAARVAAQLQARVGRAQQLHQLVVDDLDDLLARLNALDDLLAEGLGLDALDEIARDLEIHVGFQQGQPHFPQGFARVGLGDLAEAAQVPESVLQLAA